MARSGRKSRLDDALRRHLARERLAESPLSAKFEMTRGAVLRNAAGWFGNKFSAAAGQILAEGEKLNQSFNVQLRLNIGTFCKCMLQQDLRRYLARRTRTASR